MKVKLNEDWRIDNKIYSRGQVIDVSPAFYESAVREGVKIEAVKETIKKNDKDV